MIPSPSGWNPNWPMTESCIAVHRGNTICWYLIMLLPASCLAWWILAVNKERFTTEVFKRNLTLVRWSLEGWQDCCKGCSSSFNGKRGCVHHFLKLSMTLHIARKQLFDLKISRNWQSDVNNLLSPSRLVPTIAQLGYCITHSLLPSLWSKPCVSFPPSSSLTALAG